jgi:hypothetical protein
MLRSQGIPARMVVGFKGGIFNTVGAYHQFREMDAHAWVEAYLEPEQVPRDEVLPAERMELGAWVRLDPTPGPIRAAQRTRLSGWGSQLRDAMDYAQLMWSEYVLGLNERRQQRAIYDPLHTSWNAARAYLLDPQQWARRLRSFKQRFSADSLETLRGNWFNRQAAADALLLGIALIVLYVGLRWLAKLLKQLLRAAARHPRKKRRQPVDFYQKFERLLAQHGMARRASQTPREFAASASSRWADNPHLRHLASVPDVVVEAFYAVRFGNQRLDALDTQDLEQSLLRLQQGLVGSRKSEVGA